MPPRSSKKALTLCLFQSLAGVIFGWGNSEGGGLVCFDFFFRDRSGLVSPDIQFPKHDYAQRFGSCDASGNCEIGTTRQSAITGLLSVGAVIGAVSSGNIAGRVSSGSHGCCVLCSSPSSVFVSPVSSSSAST